MPYLFIFILVKRKCPNWQLGVWRVWRKSQQLRMFAAMHGCLSLVAFLWVLSSYIMVCTVSRAGHVLYRVMDSCITVFKPSYPYLVTFSCRCDKKLQGSTKGLSLGLQPVLWASVYCASKGIWALGLEAGRMIVTQDFSVPSSMQTLGLCLCLCILRSPFSRGPTEKNRLWSGPSGSLGQLVWTRL